MTARGLRIVQDTQDRYPSQDADPTPGAVMTAPVTIDPATPDPLAAATLTAAAAARLAPTAEERTWTAKAICATGDPDRLFVTGAAQREAAKLCRGCPVQMECLADALDNQVEFGVWGGLTERQRRALLKRRPDVASWRLVLEQAKTEARRGVAS
ncbi:MAG TPA: WhiB family transcriptional regulator [Nakamurella sp.]|jgi:WhiB family redox-sensing transcriptional regulator|nr:WhiB family transcriptional regulator [Nakamurella sp.]